MRTLGLTCTALLVFALPLVAQPAQPAQTPAAPPPPPPPGRLDQLLKDWEMRMRNMDTFATHVTRTEVHPLTKNVTTFVGDAAFIKPDMALIDLTHQDEVGKPDNAKTRFERYICNGKNIYEFIPKDKQIIIHEMPKGANPAEGNVIFDFLKGMTAVAAKQRFNLMLQKETEWYSYVMIQPKADADKQEFVAAQLTIWAKNPNPKGKPDIALLPCRFWYKSANGREMTYMFDNIQPNANLNKSSFVPRQIQGYEVKMAPSGPQTPPKPKTTVREQQP